MKIEFYNKESGEVALRKNYVVFDENVYEMYRGSQDLYVMYCQPEKDIAWRVVSNDQ